MPRDRYDDDYDLPSRRGSTAPGVSILGIFSLMIGVVSLMISFIPCIGAIGIGGGFFSLVLGVVGLLVAKSYNHSRGLPIAGIIVSALSCIIALMWILLIGGMGMVGPNNAGPPVTAPDVQNDEATKIPATNLSQEFQNNFVSAEANYTGRLLEVTGKVKLVSDAQPGRTIVQLGEGDNTIDCDFGWTENSDLASVETGKTVTIRGICKGVDRTSNSVKLDSCILVKTQSPLPKGKPTPATADALAKEYEGNELSGDDKYKGKFLQLSGEVERVSRSKPNQVVVTLRGGDFTMIECEFEKDAQTSLAKVEAGKKITLQGVCEGRIRGTLTLTRCTLVTGKEPVPPVATKPLVLSATTLVKDYDSNELLGDEKYKGKQLQLSGEVLRVMRNDPTKKILVYLKGGEDDEILCEFASDSKAALAKVEPGKTLKLQGTCEGRRNGTLLLANCTIVK